MGIFLIYAVINMKRAALFLVTLFTTLAGFGEDSGKSTAYTAEVTGVVCAACKSHVTAALKKLPGVDKVEFAKGEKEGVQKVTFASTTSSLTKADAIKALGDASSQYAIISLDKAK